MQQECEKEQKVETYLNNHNYQIQRETENYEKTLENAKDHEAQQTSAYIRLGDAYISKKNYSNGN
jgi:hypothetical protein